MAEDKKEIKQKYSLGSVVTGTAPAIMVDGEPITLEEAIVELLNNQNKILKAVA